MNNQSARHLHEVAPGVDPDSGEVVPQCPGCLQRDEEIRGLETEKRSWRGKYYALAEDRERKARKHELWPRALSLFDRWREKCHHEGVAWGAEYFWKIEPHLRDPSLGEFMCRRAIDGAAYDPFISPKPRRNGTRKVHDDWTLIFRDPDKVRDFAARAPQSTAVRFLDVAAPRAEGWLGSDYVMAQLDAD